MAFIWAPPDEPTGTLHPRPRPLWHETLVANWLDPAVEAHPAIQRLALLWVVVISGFALAGWLL